MAQATRGRRFGTHAGTMTHHRPAFPLPLLAAAALAAAAPSHAADVQRGAELYRQHCSSCHGAGGRPVLPGAPDFTQPIALLKPDLRLLESLRAGRGAMPAYAGLLRDAELLDLVAHLRTLR